MATPARYVPPSGTVMVTRRVLRRQLRLRPDESVNELLLYMLVVGADKYGVKIHCFQFLGNHFHALISYTKKRLPEFMQFFDGQIGRAINCRQGLWETFWSPGSYNKIDFTWDIDGLFRCMVYIITNVVAAGLVKSAKDWPGLKILPHEIGKRSIRVKRPEFFCDVDGDMPDFATLTTSMPPMLGVSEEDARKRLSSMWREREKTIQIDRKNEGKSFLGAKKVCAQSPFDFPKNNEPRRSMNPRIASPCKWTRIEKIQALVGFLQNYRVAIARFCSGDRTAVFPSGTYKMHVLLGAQCEDPQPT